MSGLFYLIIALVAVALAVQLFISTPPARVIAAGRNLIIAVLGVGAFVFLITGRVGLAAMLATIAVSLYLRGRGTGRISPSKGRRSRVRSAVLEMELDHDSGAMHGTVLAGRFEGRTLNTLDAEEFSALYTELAEDAESRQLLEAYLDRLHPGWRDDLDADASAGLGGAPSPGAMTEKEAYEILGLEPGAGGAEIRKAHRRLMQRVHPDVGGSPFLAARINAAKDLLLSRHN